MTAPSKIRISILLAILLIALIRLIQVRRAESWVSDWKNTERVAVVLLVPKTASPAERAALDSIRDVATASSGKASFWALKDWFYLEFRRYVPDRGGFPPVHLDLLGPLEVDGPPPAPPRASGDAGAWERWRRMSAFLDYFADVRRRLGFTHPNVVYVYFFPPAERASFAGVHSVAVRRARSGFVFASLDPSGVETSLTNTAHEALHVFGATDKYDADRCVYPGGYFDPWQEPRHPQRFAEVMAMGFPTDASHREHGLQYFEHMRVGVETAAEIGWIDRARHDRYYAGDRSAGPAE